MNERSKEVLSETEIEKHNSNTYDSYLHNQQIAEQTRDRYDNFITLADDLENICTKLSATPAMREIKNTQKQFDKMR